MSKTPDIIADKYEVLEVVGKGGMGTVYKAVQRSLNRIVAVKMLSEELASDIEFRARFQQEATVVARLSHPNIVSVYDIEPHEHTFCIIMEFLEGESMQARIDRQVSLPEKEATLVAAQISRALDYAHRHGVVHRDVKPDNIIILKDGTAKITDFGIARFRESKLKTQTGISMGTPKFMSPEQVTGKNLDGQSDLYSLGVCLYYALTGQVPFDGDNPIAIATKHLYEEPPPPSSVNTSILPATERIILRALAKSRDERYATGAEFSDALESLWGKPRQIVLGTPRKVTPHGETRRLETHEIPLPDGGHATPKRQPAAADTPTPAGIRSQREDEITDYSSEENGAPPLRASNLDADLRFDSARLPDGYDAEANILSRWWPALAAAALIVGGVALVVSSRDAGPPVVQGGTQVTPTPVGGLPGGTTGPAAMFDRTRTEADQFVQAGKVREAIAKWDDFAARNPDFRPAAVASILDRLAAQRPATDSKELAERRDKRGMQFYNETPPRLFLAKAYLEASAELFKGLRQPYPRAGQLGILDSSCSRTLNGLTAAEIADRARRASDAGAAAAALADDKPGQENPAAEAQFAEAIELAPLQFTSWLALADYYQAVGRKDDARVLLRYVEKYAEAASPEAQRAAKALRDL